MPSILDLPVPNKVSNPRQKSINVNDLFLTRFLPPWSRPASLPAQTWRAWVLNQPVAIVCRETLIANLLALDWKITPVNSNYKEELEPTIKYYTKLLKNGGNYEGLGLDYSGLVEWIAADVLDTPFGGAAEIGRKNRTENGRVQWIRPLDSGTLYPTLNQEYPVIQYWYGYEAVVFSPWEISRTYISPHTFIWREGWGMAPPEKVYFALDLLNRGDKYYANLLLDIPTAGILDLGDVERGFAEEWAESFKTFVNDNQTSFRVPLLYEHNNPVEFISFGKVPNDIMFNQITLKYAALVAASYGMSLSDIGLQTTSASGETLAGSIRQERRTRKTGFARIKAKIKTFFDHILPETLEFNFIDYDDELNVALGKARLATATAFKMLQDAGQFSPQEMRSQIIQDGLVSISLPDKLPPDAKPLLPEPSLPFGKDKKEPEIIGDNKPPSSGGEGEVKSFTVSFKPKIRNLDNFVRNLVYEFVPSMLESLSSVSEDEIGVWKSNVVDSLLDDTVSLGIVMSNALKTKSLGVFEFGDIETELASMLGDEYEHINLKKYADRLKANIKSKVGEFLGRSALVTTMLSDAEPEALPDDVVTRITATLPEYIYALVNIEAKSILDEIQSTPSHLPEAIQMKSLPKPRKENVQNITVNVPEQKSQINFEIPPSHTDVTLNVPVQEPPVVNVSSPVEVNIPEQEAPIVNVSVPDRSIQVNIPEQPAPVVNVNVPEQATPIVNVNVDPTPVQIKNTVNVPPEKKEKKKITIRKDGNTWTGESTET